MSLYPKKNSTFLNLKPVGKEEEEEEEEEEPIDVSVFSEENQDFIQFKNNVKEWLTIDDDIITLQEAIKQRRRRKTDLTPGILDFMTRYRIEDLNTQEGKLKYAKSLCTKPLNKNYLVHKLSDYFRDVEKGQNLTQFLMENREKEERIKLSRVKPKKVNIQF
jgi:hypothetical protein